MIANAAPSQYTPEAQTSPASAQVRCTTLMAELNDALRTLYNEGHAVVVSVSTEYKQPRTDALPQVSLTVDPGTGRDAALDG
jgi:hypothetical protein